MVKFEVRVHTDRLAKPMDLAKQGPVSAFNVENAVVCLEIRDCLADACSAGSRSVIGSKID
jgi:hypothetical protein